MPVTHDMEKLDSDGGVVVVVRCASGAGVAAASAGYGLLCQQRSRSARRTWRETWQGMLNRIRKMLLGTRRDHDQIKDVLEHEAFLSLLLTVWYGIVQSIKLAQACLHPPIHILISRCL